MCTPRRAPELQATHQAGRFPQGCESLALIPNPQSRSPTCVQAKPSLNRWTRGLFTSLSFKTK